MNISWCDINPTLYQDYPWRKMIYNFFFYFRNLVNTAVSSERLVREMWEFQDKLIRHSRCRTLPALDCWCLFCEFHLRNTRAVLSQCPEDGEEDEHTESWPCELKWSPWRTDWTWGWTCWPSCSATCPARAWGSCQVTLIRNVNYWSNDVLHCQSIDLKLTINMVLCQMELLSSTCSHIPQT